MGQNRSRYRSLVVMVMTYLVLSALTRLALWGFFGIPSGVAATRLPLIMGSGLINDLVQSVYLFMPLALYLLLATPRFYASRSGRLLLMAGGFLMVYGMLYLGIAEYFFFDEFDARFNLVAVDYLIYPTEVLGTIDDAYPVLPVSAGLFALALLVFWRLWPRIAPSAEPDAPRFARRAKVFGLQVALVVLAGFFYNTDTLDFSQNRVGNELAHNGPSSFFNAFHTNNIKYPTYYRTGDKAAMLKLLREDLARGGGEFVGDQGVTRRFPQRAGFGKLNIVLLSEESFGAEFSGVYGDDRGLTPEFDALSKEGVLFTHAYATGTRTVRGLEAFSASTPPIPSESVVKRPGNEAMVTWGEVLDKLGYQSSFLYGGYGAFDNMNSYFGANGYALSDRGDIENPKFTNVWGVSDEDLFAHAIRYFDARASEGKPFYSIIMSTSNHKPFTFPEGVPGVQAKGGGRSAGVRYADYAIGEFFREAKKHDWYNNTVFIVVADHGARVYGAAQVPLFSYEIPMLMIAPGHLAPARVDTPISQIDVMPTVLGMLGLAYESPSFGQDVLHWPAGQPRSLLFNHNHNVALMQGDELAILGLRKEVGSESYRRDAGPPRRKSDHFEEIAPDARLIDLATAYYQTAYDLYVHNGYGDASSAASAGQPEKH